MREGGKGFSAVGKARTFTENFLTAHETANETCDNVTKIDVEMDLHNNMIGREYGMNHCSEQKSKEIINGTEKEINIVKCECLDASGNEMCINNIEKDYLYDDFDYYAMPKIFSDFYQMGLDSVFATTIEEIEAQENADNLVHLKNDQYSVCGNLPIYATWETSSSSCEWYCNDYEAYQSLTVNNEKKCEPRSETLKCYFGWYDKYFMINTKSVGYGENIDNDNTYSVDVNYLSGFRVIRNGELVFKPAPFRAELFDYAGLMPLYLLIPRFSNESLTIALQNPDDQDEVQQAICSAITGGAALHLDALEWQFASTIFTNETMVEIPTSIADYWIINEFNNLGSWDEVDLSPFAEDLNFMYETITQEVITNYAPAEPNENNPFDLCELNWFKFLFPYFCTATLELK